MKNRKRKYILLALAGIGFILVLCVMIFLVWLSWIGDRDISSEKKFYKKSDIGTNVYQLTTNKSEEGIYYQEPNYFSPDNSKFLYRSDRLKSIGLFTVDIESGDITALKKGIIGHAPTWSKDGSEVFIGQLGKIAALNVDDYEERSIDVPGFYLLTFLHLNPSGDKLVFVEQGLDEHKRLSVVNTDGSGYESLYTLDYEDEFYLDHPTFLDDESILFLTRGKDRNAEGDFNKPYIIKLNGDNRRLPVQCSHYDVHPNKDKGLDNFRVSFA